MRDLQSQVGELREELFELRVQDTTKELKDSSRISQARRDIARVLTVLAEKRRQDQTPTD